MLTQARSRIATLTIRPPTPAIEGMTVRVNGTAINALVLGAPRAMNAGSARIEAEAPGGLTFTREIELTEGQAAEVELAFNNPAPAPPLPPRIRPTPIPRPSTVNVGAIALLATGGAFALGGAILAPIARSFTSDCQDQGDGSVVCAPRFVEHARLGEPLYYSGLVSVGVGVAMVGAGVGWMLASRTTSHNNVSVGIFPGFLTYQRSF